MRASARTSSWRQSAGSRQRPDVQRGRGLLWHFVSAATRDVKVGCARETEGGRLGGRCRREGGESDRTHREGKRYVIGEYLTEVVVSVAPSASTSQYIPPSKLHLPDRPWLERVQVRGTEEEEAMLGGFGDLEIV